MAAEGQIVGKVLGIYFCPSDGGDVRDGSVRNTMIQVDTITAEANMGLVAGGILDRYHRGVRKGFWDEADRKMREEKMRQVAIVTRPALDSIGMSGEMSRRNLEIDMDPDELLLLLHQRAILAVGIQVLIGLEIDCNACNRPSKLFNGTNDFARLGTFGGARGRIIRGGDISVEDVISISNSKSS